MNGVIAAIQAEASLQGIDWKLVQAICQKESSLNTQAVRFEPQYKYVYKVDELAKKLRITSATEEATQKFSYGLGQIMGAVCREYGYSEPLMLLLSDWRVALSYSVKHLVNYSKKYKTTSDVIAAYNAGSPRRTEAGLYVNQSYVDSVLKNYQAI